MRAALARTVVCSLVALLAFAGAQAQPQHAHAHGVAKLTVAVENKSVTLQLESPLDSLIGFEHRPRTEAQTTAVAALQARMKAAQELFRFDAAAGCTLVRSEAESAIFRPATVTAAKEEHADLDATFEFSCAAPDKLTALEVGLFAAYPRLREMSVEVATASGQFKRDLTSPAKTVSLRR